MTDHGLKLAADKTEIVLITKRHLLNILPRQVGEETEQKKAAKKYLGILLDSKLKFSPQIKRAADEAATVTTAMSRIWLNQQAKTFQAIITYVSYALNTTLWCRNVA